MSPLTGSICEDVKFLQRFTTRLHKRPIIPPRIVVDMRESDFVEPWFEEGNGFENLFWHPACRNT